MSPFTLTPPRKVLPRRWCRWHLDFIPAAAATLVGLIGSGPDGEPIGVYACRDCRRAQGLMPYEADGPAGVAYLKDGSHVAL